MKKRYPTKSKSHRRDARPRRVNGLDARATLYKTTRELQAAKQELLAIQSEVEADGLRYRDLFEFSPDAYLVTDARGSIRETNEAAARLLNIPDIYTMGKPLFLFVHKDDRPRYWEVLRQLRSQPEGRFLLRLVPRDKEAMVADVRITGVRNWDGSVGSLRWTFRDVTEQERTRQQIGQHHDQLRWLASELSRAEERERRRIATGIHDRVSQTLALAKMMLGKAARAATPECRGTLDEISQLLSQVIDESRTLTFELSPPILYELGLLPAIEWLAELMQRRHGIRITVAGDRREPQLEESLRVLVFQAVRELLTNVVKHARASQASVEFSFHDGQLYVTVEDDGSGMPPRLPPHEAGAGFGLFSLRTRLEQIGGHLQLKPRSNGGTRATILVPALATAAPVSDNGRPRHKHLPEKQA